jgi:hypothetical protein
MQLDCSIPLQSLHHADTADLAWPMYSGNMVVDWIVVSVVHNKAAQLQIVRCLHSFWDMGLYMHVAACC